MPPEEFRREFGELYDRLVAEQRAHSITPIDRTKLLNTVIEEVFRIQAFVRGQGNEHPSAEKLCDWIHECYLLGLPREAGVLWSLINRLEVEPWYYERTKRIALALQATSTS